MAAAAFQAASSDSTAYPQFTQRFAEFPGPSEPGKSCETLTGVFKAFRKRVAIRGAANHGCSRLSGGHF
jgi:hypothetical protein